MKTKEKLIKNAIFLAATTLVLVVVTVAWFSSGALLSVNPVAGDVESSGYGYMLYEAEDTDKNGVLDATEALPEKWIAVPGLSIDVNNIVPNQYRFFKAVVFPGTKTSIQFTFGGINVDLLDPEVTLQEFLSLIHVKFRTEDDTIPPAALPDGGIIDESMYDLLGDPVAGSVQVYDLNLTGYTGTSFTIYYNIGVYPTAVPNEKTLGSSVSISTLEFTAN